MTKQTEALKQTAVDYLLDEAKLLADDRPVEVGYLAEWTLNAEHMIRKLVKALAEKPAQHACKWPTCQSEQYQQNLAEQIKRDLYTGQTAQQQKPVVTRFPMKLACTKCGAVDEGFLDVESEAPPASKPLTDEEILWLVPGLLDCLCDPYDYNKTGDEYASIPKDMIRLARAIEAAHNIKENT